MNKKNTCEKQGWTVIGEYTSEAEASIVKGMLETNGVKVVMNDEIISNVYPMTSTWAPVRLYVRECDLHDAQVLING